ncbi:MAG TPA: Holliday junction branch migration protein RuvA [Candidatus Kaiserbacteria bacterium]|nr:Holliday junction branch migration protein RuvA [Candidatus Kaiserbacteria bacterium]
MIRTVEGIVQSIDTGGVIVTVAGFGLRIHTNEEDSLTVGKRAFFSTHMLMKQDGIRLYGFADVADRDFFEQLLTVSGFGPKTTMSLLRRATRKQLGVAIANRDVEYLTRVVGLGKKSAGKLVVELAEKIMIDGTQQKNTDTEVFDMLVALGYTERDAQKALSTIPVTIVGNEKRLKAALNGGVSQ